MESKQAEIASLKIGNYVVFDGKVCVIKDMQTSKTGKHGHAKCRVEAVSVLDDQKIIKVMPGRDKVDVPLIEKKTAQVLSISNDTASVMDMETYETFELKIPDELKGQVKEGSQVLYWIVMNQKVMKQIKG